MYFCLKKLNKWIVSECKSRCLIFPPQECITQNNTQKKQKIKNKKIARVFLRERVWQVEFAYFRKLLWLEWLKLLCIIRDRDNLLNCSKILTYRKVTALETQNFRHHFLLCFINFSFIHCKRMCVLHLKTEKLHDAN